MLVDFISCLAARLQWMGRLRETLRAWAWQVFLVSTHRLVVGAPTAGSRASLPWATHGGQDWEVRPVLLRHCRGWLVPPGAVGGITASSTLASSALVALSLPASAPAVCHCEIGLEGSKKEEGGWILI
jgi:hypothetical protein